MHADPPPGAMSHSAPAPRPNRFRHRRVSRPNAEPHHGGSRGTGACRARRVTLGATPEGDATRTHALTWPNVVETTTAVEVMGRYSNPDNVARLHRILSGQGRDRPSHRPVPSVRQTTDPIDRFATFRAAGAVPGRGTRDRARQRTRHPPRHRLQPPATGRRPDPLSHPQRRRRRGRSEDVRGRSVSRCDRRTLRRGRSDRAERVPSRSGYRHEVPAPTSGASELQRQRER